jgi:citrate lyase subunit beta/citryl-CoA lyase
MEKARRSAADALIFDLEDAVAPQRRQEARKHVAALLTEAGGPPVFVRVNHPSTGEMEADLDAVVSANLYGVVLPKAETREEVERLDRALGQREKQIGREIGSIAVLPLVESCRGIHFTYDMATASPRVLGMVFSSGEAGDFMADLEGVWTQDGQAMFYARSKLVCETRAAGLSWPIDGVVMNLSDESILRSECELARRLGFQAKMAIHPKQLPLINEIFTPSAAEVEYSQRLVDAFREARDAGTGAFSYQGMMIDKANIARAERTLARARAVSGADAPQRGSR